MFPAEAFAAVRMFRLEPDSGLSWALLILLQGIVCSPGAVQGRREDFREAGLPMPGLTSANVSSGKALRFSDIPEISHENSKLLLSQSDR